MLKNKIAIVTGGANGIGRAICLEFVKQGAKVVLCDIDSKAGKEVEKQIKHLGYEAFFLKCDVRKEEDVLKVINYTKKKYNQIDILVNNAGVFLEKKISQISKEEWDNVIETNLRGVFFFISSVSKHMIENKSGKIISISSIFGEVGFKNTSVYCASSGAIINMTRELVLELSPHKININVVSSGVVVTEMIGSLLSDPAKKKEILSNIPLERIGTCEEVADAVTFLASNRASFITGHNLVVDGGWLAH